MSTSGRPLEIDGSVLEGGGQILRNTAALSCLLCKPIHVKNIRAGRSKPGLRPQHMTGLQLISKICQGRLEGDVVQSTEVTLIPSTIQASSYTADTKTAGSICLLLQAALPCLLFAGAPSMLTLRGGTNAEMAPQIDYLPMVFGPLAKLFGVTFECEIKRRGYFPKGGGEVVVRTQPVQYLKAVQRTRLGKISSIVGRAFVAGVLPLKVAHSMASSAKHVISKHYRNVPIDIETVKEECAVGNGCGIIITATTDEGNILSGSALGKRGVPAEKVGEEAGNMLVENLSQGGCVDQYLQDQIIILMALAKGTSVIHCGSLTQHTQTAIWVAEQLTNAKFNVSTMSEHKTVIECQGIGLVNEQL